MKPTGKCLKEFEAWLLIWLKDNVAWTTETPTQEDIDHFYSFPDAMKYGVLEDYFDSVEDETETRYIGRISRGIDLYFVEHKECMDRYYSREEARTAAMEKANEIRNGQLN